MAPEEVTRSWREGLEGPALDIATSVSREIRVIAGPGTGKSYAMRCRVARLLEDGIPPEEILAVTFTRASARDLRSELKKIGIEEVERIRASTLHSLCFEILKDEVVLEATGRTPRILMKFEQKYALHDLKTTGRNFKHCERLLHAYEASWARDQEDVPGLPNTEADQTFHHDLLNWLQFHEAMLVGELATETLKFLRANPQSDVLSAYSHILVDEFQDLNRANQELIELLSAESCVAIVGDEDQSIYATLQHAQPEGIRTYKDLHPETEDFRLTECRRCPQRVVEIANSLISQNTNRQTISIVPRAANPLGELDIIQFESIDEQATQVAEIVRDYVDSKGVDPSEVMVLTPRRLASYQLRNSIRAKGLDVHSYFFEEALDTRVAQRQFSLLSLLADRSDKVSLRCWLGGHRPDYSVPPYKHIREYCETSDKAPNEALQEFVAGFVSIRGAERLKEEYRELLNELARLSTLFGQELVDNLFPDGTPDLEEIRIAAIEVLGTVSPNVTADELYRELLVRILFPEPPPASGAVRLMSLHSSKGLSAKLVVVTSCVESWIPSLDPELNGQAALRELEEQRRLFYVALTRSTDSLVLTSFRQMPIRDAARMNLERRRTVRNQVIVNASRFMNELGLAAPRARVG